MADMGLGLPEVVRPTDGGWVNPGYFVNDRYVFRFNARDPHLPKFQRERLAYDLTARKGLPGPQVISLDVSRHLCPYDVIVTSVIQGSTLEQAWSGLSTEDRGRLASAAGSTLGSIHEIPISRFGGLSSEEDQYSTWYKCVESLFMKHLQRAKLLGIFNETIENDCKTLLDRYSGALAKIKTPSLLHGDYQFGNILVDQGRIRGIIDYEWSLAGDPAYDLAYLARLEDSTPGARELFVRGYLSAHGNRDSNLFDRVPIYKTLRNIELCIVAHEHFGEADAAEYRTITAEAIGLLLKDTKAGISGARKG
ncbi:MAG: hypothetical protein A2Z97_11965 [Bdellovibrionales bacterium GWB1_52_6]|nr:MAG: hypothetical protein A2Z97_11965 [Bdellovibrionales bacterium GWB1_52_6]